VTEAIEDAVHVIRLVGVGPLPREASSSALYLRSV